MVGEISIGLHPKEVKLIGNGLPIKGKVEMSTPARGFYFRPLKVYTTGGSYWDANPRYSKKSNGITSVYVGFPREGLSLLRKKKMVATEYPQRGTTFRKIRIMPEGMMP
jgi:hypothetical protein